MATNHLLGPVIVGYKPPPRVCAALQAQCVDVDIPDHMLGGEEVVRRAQACNARALLVDAGQKLDAAAIMALPKSCCIIATCSVGFDHLAVAAAQRRKIVVTHTPHVLTECTADLTLMLILCASRRGRDYLEVTRSGWPKRLGQADLLGQRLGGRTLGIVGMGRIGQAVARRARAFGMTIAYHNRRRLAPADEAGARYHASLEALLPEADILSLHAPGTAATQGLIDAAALARLPKGAVLINVARGSLVDEQALFDSLQSGHLFAAGLDVFAQEPVGHAGLIGLPQVFATPHCGSATVETRNAMGQMCIDAIVAALVGQTPECVIHTGHDRMP